jgi:hypothetical protein
MLALRMLTLPIAMAAFVILYVVANKAPHAVEVLNIFVWVLLLFVVLSKISRRRPNSRLHE